MQSCGYGCVLTVAISYRVAHKPYVAVGHGLLFIDRLARPVGGWACVSGRGIPQHGARYAGYGVGVWKKGRGPRIFGVLKRLWIPLLVLVVVVAGGFTVSRLHGIFGADNRPSYADTKASDSKPFNPKQLIYEVFGPPARWRTSAISIADAEPQYIKGCSLPWTLDFDDRLRRRPWAASWRRATATASVAASWWTRGEGREDLRQGQCLHLLPV